MKYLGLILSLLMLANCSELNPTYKVIVENPDGVELECLREVDEETSTFNTSETTIEFTAGTANTFIYISCQKQVAGGETIQAFFKRNDDVVEQDETDVEFGIVSASGLTR